MSAKDQGL